MTSRSGSYKARMISRSCTLSLIFEGFLECEKRLSKVSRERRTWRLSEAVGSFSKRASRASLLSGERAEATCETSCSLCSRTASRMMAVREPLLGISIRRFGRKCRACSKSDSRPELRTNERLQVVKKSFSRLFVKRTIAEVLKDKALVAAGSSLFVGGRIHRNCFDHELTGSVLQIGGMVTAQEKGVSRSEVTELNEEADLGCGRAQRLDDLQHRLQHCEALAALNGTQARRRIEDVLLLWGEDLLARHIAKVLSQNH